MQPVLQDQWTPWRRRLGANLRVARQTNGVALADLADLCGYNGRNVAAYERGERVPSAQQVAWLAHSYGVGVQVLFPPVPGTDAAEPVLTPAAAAKAVAYADRDLRDVFPDQHALLVALHARRNLHVQEGTL